MPVDPTPAPFDPHTITLYRGCHGSRSAGVCLLEAVAWFAGETHTDHPACVCPVLAIYGRTLNDWLSDEERQLLRPLIPRLVGTRTDVAVDARYAVMAQDIITRLTAQRPALVAQLRACSWNDLGDRVEALPAVTDRADALRVGDALCRIRDDAWTRHRGQHVTCRYRDVSGGFAGTGAINDTYAAYKAAYSVAAYAYAAANRDGQDAAYTAVCAYAAEAEIVDTATRHLSLDARRAARRPIVDAAIATYVRAIEAVYA